MRRLWVGYRKTEVFSLIIAAIELLFILLVVFHDGTLLDFARQHGGKAGWIPIIMFAVPTILLATWYLNGATTQQDEVAKDSHH